jgi:DNA sulfur modification protein DndD
LEELKKHINQKAALQKRNEEIASYLSVDINEKEVKKIFKEIKELEFQLAGLEAEQKQLQTERKTANGVYLTKKAEFSQFVENTLSAFEKNDEINRMLSFTLLAEQVNEQYKIALQRAKIRNLADTMTVCYKKLLGKKNLINEIEMNPDTLDYYYLDAEGNDIPRKSLSAGEKQLMIISMLWALALCSKKKLPVIIDTPMARLDSVHRKALIERYFPFASDQTIILSTDSEIFGDYYKLLKKNSSNLFTLVYDEERKCSTIQTGYFEEENDDN